MLCAAGPESGHILHLEVAIPADGRPGCPRRPQIEVLRTEVFIASASKPPPRGVRHIYTRAARRAHRRGQGTARLPSHDPRPPLPARRGDALGRRPRRLLRPVPAGRRVLGVVCGLLRGAFHGRVRRYPHRRRPAGHPPGPERRMLDGRHGRPRRGGGGLGGSGGGHRRSRPDTDHLHELGGLAEVVRGSPRRRRLHLLQRPSGGELGPGAARRRRQSPVLPRPAPGPQHGLPARPRRLGDGGVGSPAGAGRPVRGGGQAGSLPAVERPLLGAPALPARPRRGIPGREPGRDRDRPSRVQPRGGLAGR